MSFDNMSFDNMSFDNMLFDNMLLDNMLFDNMSFDNMLFNNIPFDNMSFDNMLFNNMPFNNMLFNNMSFDNMLFDILAFDIKLQPHLIRAVLICSLRSGGSLSAEQRRKWYKGIANFAEVDFQPNLLLCWLAGEQKLNQRIHSSPPPSSTDQIFINGSNY
jgi:hypothetical protein